MRHADFDQRLASLDALPVHRGRLMRVWLQGQPLDQGTRRRDSQHFLPLALRNAVPALTAELDGLARVRSEHAGNDGSRLLVELADGQMVESVLLPRDGLCVSTQVGCAVGCRFCMTGKSGLIRQVTSMEILAQVVLARRMRAVKKVVFMGMGEPAHNLENVLEAIDLLGTEGGIGHKNLVFSTVGDPRVFEALPRQRIKPRWRCRYTTKAELRAHLLPRARESRPKRWSNSANSTPATRAIRSSINGRCSRASTTATTSSTPSCACSRASTACSTSFPSTAWKAMITSAPIPSASARSSAACTAVAC